MIKFIFILVLTTFAGSTYAVPMMYSYTSGQLAPSGLSGVPAVTSLSVSFTADLLPSLTEDNAPGSVIDWVFSDGITSATSGFSVVQFLAWTDSASVLTKVDILLRTNVTLLLGDVLEVRMRYVPGDHYASTTYCTSAREDGSCAGTIAAVSRQVTGGLTPVPVPTTIALFGLGLAGLGWKRHKRA